MSPRREDDRLATGRGSYTDDLRHEGALHIAFVRSLHASAIIRSIDSAAALEYSGVVAVLTGADMTADGFDDCPAPFKLDQGDGNFAFEPRESAENPAIQAVQLGIRHAVLARIEIVKVGELITKAVAQETISFPNFRDPLVTYDDVIAVILRDHPKPEHVCAVFLDISG